MLQRQQTEKLVSQYVKFRDNTLKAEDGSGHAQSPSRLGVGLVSKMATKWRKPSSVKEGNAMIKLSEQVQGQNKAITQPGSARNAMHEFIQTNDARRSSSATKIQSRERGRQQRNLASQQRLVKQNSGTSHSSRRNQKQKQQRIAGPRISGPRMSVLSLEQ